MLFLTKKMEKPVKHLGQFLGRRQHENLRTGQQFSVEKLRRHEFKNSVLTLTCFEKIPPPKRNQTCFTLKLQNLEIFSLPQSAALIWCAATSDPFRRTDCADCRSSYRTSSAGSYWGHWTFQPDPGHGFSGALAFRTEYLGLSALVLPAHRLQPGFRGWEPFQQTWHPWPVLPSLRRVERGLLYSKFPHPTCASSC
jgi:hypothetical protein